MKNHIPDLIDFLSSAPLFSSVPDQQVKELAGLFEKKEVKKGDVVCTQGEPGDSMYVIRSGIVSLYKTIGRQEHFVADLKRGDFFGEISLLSEEPRNATAIASLDADLFCLTREHFESLLKKDKSIGLYLSRHYAKRMTVDLHDSINQKKAPKFYAVSSSGPDLGVSHFLYSVSFHVSDESTKRVLVIEPHLSTARIMQKYELTRIDCPDPGLFQILPAGSYQPNDIHWFSHDSGFHVLQLKTGFSDRLSEIMPVLMSGIQESYDVVFFNLTHHLNDMERLFVRLCDRTLLLIHNTLEKFEKVQKRLSQLEEICGASAFLGRIRVGVSHLYGEKGIVRQVLKEKLNLSETPNIWVDRSSRAFNDQIDTKKCFPVRGSRAVARDIAGIRLGLALGAGAARGWAHIGVLKVLEDAGIHIDMISGASMGALVGGIYAASASVNELKKNTIDLFSTRADARKKIFDYTLPQKGILKGKKAENLVRTAVNNADFLDLKIPTYIVSVDILKGEEIIFETGDVTGAIRSSIAIPAVFNPYQHHGRWMVDGGLLNPVPVDVLFRKGADMAIAVSIEPRTGGSSKSRKAPGIKQIVSQTISIVHGRATGNFVKSADLVLYPDVKDYAWDDFHKGLPLMRCGMEECFGRLKDIQKIIKENERGKSINATN